MQHMSAVCCGNHAAKHTPMRCMYVQRVGIDLPCAPSLCCFQQFWLVSSKKAAGVQAFRCTVFCTSMVTHSSWIAIRAPSFW